MKVHRFSQIQSFLDRAEPWLLSAEAENNIILGVAQQLLKGDHGYKDPIYLATVAIEGEVLGCALRTPPYPLNLTKMPQETIPLLLDDVADIYSSLPGVSGPEHLSGRFAELWVQDSEKISKLQHKFRLYSLKQVIYPASPATGVFRRAEAQDLDLAINWLDAFHEDVAMPIKDTEERTRQLIEQHSLFLWEDGEPISMAAKVADTPNGARIGYVYTPPESRGRGYASVCVAELSQLLLNQGRQFCSLFADLEDPTPNAIYERLGYRKVSDLAAFTFS